MASEQNNKLANNKFFAAQNLCKFVEIEHRIQKDHLIDVIYLDGPQ